MRTALSTIHRLFAATSIAACAGFALADDPPRIDAELQAALDKIGRLEATVDRLNSRLGELEQADGERWLSEERADQIRAVVTDVLADAETRSNFQSDAALAGYAPGKGFYLQSADGNFALRISGQLQVRYILNNAGEQPTDYGFQIRRAKLAFSGNIIDKTWTYKIQGAFNRGSNNVTTGNTANFLIEDAWIDKDFGGGFSMKLGQFKAPWLQEDLVSSRRQLAVERSLLMGYFQQNYGRGIQLQWQSDRFRLRAWTGNGLPSPFAGLANNVTSSNWNTDPTSYSFVARGEVKFGDADWKDLDDFNSFRGGKTGVMLGVSGLYQKYNDGTVFGDANASVVSGVTGDVTVDFGGASLFAYVVWENGQDATTPAGAPLGDPNPWGFLVQGGYMLTDDFEPFVRYEYGVLGASRPLYTNDELNMLTVGFNWFLKRNDLKFTLDWGINIDSLGLPAYGAVGYGSNSGAGYRNDLPGQDLQWSLRAQMQLLF
jgi:hypothetical protein